MPIPVVSSACAFAWAKPTVTDPATGDMTDPFAARPWARRLCLVGLGLALSLGQAPTHLWWVALPVLAIWLFLTRFVVSGKAAFGAGFWFGIGYFALSLRWIVSPFMVDPARDGWMAPFAIVLLSAGLALLWGLAGLLALKLGRGRALAFALWLTAAEVMRSLVLTGFPWALIGHIWIDTPIAQLAAFIGPHGLTVLAVCLAWCLMVGVTASRWALAGPVLASVAAFWLAPGPIPAPAPDATTIRLVQPNAPQDEKWDVAMRDVFFERMLDYSAATPRPDLIVWPETAVQDLLEWADPSLQAMSDAAQGVPLVTGINRRPNLRYFNALVVLGQDGAIDAIYDKAHLVPFGEYFPGGELAARWGLHGFAASEGQAFSTGGDQPLLDLPGIGSARALICYEGIFAEEIVIGDRPRLLLLITNDAWFGRGAGPAQHLAQARLRAIEQGLPMVRVANTGISAMIDARGRLTGVIPLGQADYLDAALPPTLDPTLYARLGDMPLLLVLTLALLGLVIPRRAA